MRRRRGRYNKVEPVPNREYVMLSDRASDYVRRRAGAQGTVSAYLRELVRRDMEAEAAQNAALSVQGAD